METEQNNPVSTQIAKATEIENQEFIKKMLNKRTIRSYVLVITGTILYSIGVVWLLQIGGFFSGGVTGTSQLIVGLVIKFGGPTSIEKFLGIFVGLINVPLVLWGWRGVSRRFAVLTVISIVLQSLTITLLTNLTISPFVKLLESGEGLIDALRDGNLNILKTAENVALQEAFMKNMQTGTKIILALIGGGITGMGAALCLKAGGSTGGMDIIANYLMMKKRIAFTKYQSTVDVTIILLSSLISVENVLYTLVRLYIYIRVIDMIYTNYKITRIEVISSNGEELRQALLKQFHHGITIFDAVGGYTLSNRKVLEMYVSAYEVHDYIRIIHIIDPCAFVVTTKVRILSGNYIQKTII